MIVNVLFKKIVSIKKEIKLWASGLSCLGVLFNTVY